MNQIDNLTTVRERNKHKRLMGWALIYLLLIAIFVFVVYWQAKQVNTMGFAKGELQLITTKTKYNLGNKISFTLKNNLDHPVTFVNNCPKEPLFVYSWTNNSWVRIHDTAAASTCKGEPKQQTILPKKSYTQSFANWPNLFNRPGIYRIAALASNYTALPFTDFQVIAPSTPKIQTQIIIQKIITPIYITAPTSGGDRGGGGTDN